MTLKSISQPHGYYGFTAPTLETYTSSTNKLKTLPLTTIVDALWTLKYPQPMIHDIKKITKEQQTDNHVGLAITVRFIPWRNDLMPLKPKGYESPEYAAFSMVTSSGTDYKYSIVMETVGPYESIGGDIKLSMLKQNKNIASIICDGGIRDIDTVKEYDIPIYASSITCKQGPATQIPWSVNEVINLPGNVAVAPYDFIVADEYNVVVVPQVCVDKVIGIADVRETIEEVIKMEIENNGDNTSIIPNYYPFPTPTNQGNHNKLVELLKKYKKWDEVQAMQNDIFS